MLKIIFLVVCILAIIYAICNTEMPLLTQKNALLIVEPMRSVEPMTSKSNIIYKNNKSINRKQKRKN